ncbi:MAG TPA: hypothetical protein VIN10_04070 [Bacteroidales bacterium]
MIVGTLLLITILLYGGGYDTIMLNPDMKKNVHTFVVDKNRVKEIDHILKEMEKSQKAFHKVVKKGPFKEFEALNINPDATRAEYETLLNAYFVDLKALQQSQIDSELKIRSDIKEAEWNQIMEKVLATPDKSKAKKQMEKLTEKMHSGMIKACEKSISDPSNLSAAKTLIDNYRAKAELLGESIMDIGYKNQETIRNYNASREQYEDIRAEMLAKRLDFMQTVVDLRFELLEITPQKEWKGLATELNKTLSKAGEM